MKLYCVAGALLLLSGVVYCDETINSTREGRDYAYPGGDYDFNTVYPPADKWSYPSVHPNQYPGITFNYYENPKLTKPYHYLEYLTHNNYLPTLNGFKNIS